MKKIDKKILKTCFISTLIFIIIAHGYCYFNLNFSHDSLRVWHWGNYGDSVQLGRFLIPIYILIRGKYYPPLIIGVLSLLFIALSVYLTVDLLKLKDKASTFLISGVYTTCSTITLLNATYINYTDMYCLSILLYILGVYILFKTKKLYRFLSIIPFVCATGIYQSYIGIPIGLSIINIINKLINNKTTKEAIIDGIIAIASILISLLLYSALYKFILNAMNLTATDSYNGMVGVGQYGSLENIKYFDFWRLYYTAFSRAQNLLVLASNKADNRYFEDYFEMIPDVHEFSEIKKFADVKAINYKHVYSFTSHISVYDECPLKYKYYKEYSFARNRMFHTSVGSLVHATLEDMNRNIIAGHRERVNETNIKEWFYLNYQVMREKTGYFLTDEQQKNALEQVIRYYKHRENELGVVWKAEEEINLVLPDYILQGVIDLIEGSGDTVEIVDYKTGPKPDIKKYPNHIKNYRKQLEIYAYLVEKRYEKKVSRMHLYYTNCADGDPLITFEWSKEAVDNTVSQISETIRKIESKDFKGNAKNSYVCKFCDMRYLCRKIDDIDKIK